MSLVAMPSVEEGLVVGMAFSGGDATSSGLVSLSGDWISKWVKMDNSFLFYLFIFYPWCGF
jgi:hypothetical protein